MSEQQKPPRFLIKWVHRLVRWDRVEEISGDLIEEYAFNRKRMSSWKARWRLCVGLLYFLKPDNLKLKTSMTRMLLSSYFRIGWRNLTLHKGYSTLNILGLTLGICSALLMTLYVLDELSYDRIFTHADDLYRIGGEINMENGQMRAAITPAPLGHTLQEQIPEIAAYASLFKSPAFAIRLDHQLYNESEAFSTSSDFFQVFDFKLLAGNPETVFAQPHSMVISEGRARSLFGTVDVLGKKVETEDFHDRTFTIRGIMQDPPPNTHLRPEILTYVDDEWYQSDTWNDWNNYTYVRLHEHASYTQFAANLEDVYAQVLQPAVEENWNGTGKLLIESVTSIHLQSNLEWDFHSGGSLQAVWIAIGLALFLLIVVSINYMNMATTRAVQRVKEIGIRAMLGSNRGMIRLQYVAESMLITCISAILAVVLAWLLLPWFNLLAGKTLEFNDLLQPGILAMFLLYAALIGIIGGSYPGFFLSRLHAADIFRKRIGFGKGHLPMGKLLNMIQFSSALILVILAWLAHEQLLFVQHYDMGFDQERVIKLNFNNRINGEKYGTLRTELSSLSSIRQVAFTGSAPGEAISTDGLSFETPNGGFEIQKVEFNFTDHQLQPLLNLQLVAGRNIRESEEWARSAFVNEKLVRQLGYQHVDQIIGKRVLLPLGDDFYATIVGVLADFHIQSLHHEIQPLIYVNFVPNAQVALLKVEGGSLDEIFDHIDRTTETVLGITTYSTSFLDDSIWLKYQQDTRQGQLLLIFSVLIIILSLIGLMGLVSYSVELKMKEMIIRKIFGAGFGHVLHIFIRQYAMVVIISLLIAVPIAYVLGTTWLANFSYRIPMYAHYFVLSALGIILVVSGIIYLQSKKGYNINPVEKLVRD